MYEFLLQKQLGHELMGMEKLEPQCCFLQTPAISIQTHEAKGKKGKRIH